MVMKRELAERHPWALTNILKAFKQAAALSDRRRVEHAEYYFETGVLPAEAQKAFAAPLITHGGAGKSQGDRDHRAIFAGAGADAETDAARGSVSGEHDQSVACAVQRTAAVIAGLDPAIHRS